VKKISKILGILNKSEKIYLFFIFILSILSIFVEFAGLAIIPVFLSSLLEINIQNEIIGSLSNIIKNNFQNEFLFLIGAIVLIFFFKSIFIFFTKIFEVVNYKRIRLRITEKLLKINLNSSLGSIQSETPATNFWKMQIIMNFVSVMDSYIYMFRNIGYILVIITFLLFYNGFQIFYFFLGIFIVILFFYYFFSETIKNTGKKAELEKKKRINVLQNILNGIKDIFIFQKQNFFLKEFQKNNIEHEKATQKNVIISNIPIQFLEFIGVTFICFFIYLSSTLGESPETIVINSSVLVYGGIRIIAILKSMMTSINNIKKNSYVVEVIYSELTKKIINNDNLILYQSFEENENNLIKIKNLSFHYPFGETLFKNLNLNFNQNKIYAIYGESGVGKSTFLDLLLGICECEKDNININCNRDEVGYVPQECYLSKTSIMKNIAFGIHDHEIDFNLLEKSAKQAGIYDFIQTLPKKFETDLNIFGSNISVGQKQRIGIARTLYFDPKIILLDEPTSALDAETESDFMKTLNNIKNNRLIIMTTHKENIITKVDHVLTLKNKTIYER
tara:strand:+ start:5662 stop:7344 length:1683 start_codon:yes stop_codon:yes gene_type:complete